MKISNNALNFLLAQYRAIFKRAYVKGIASAVLLTAGLAAGQAQADTLTSGAASTTPWDEVTTNVTVNDNETFVGVDADNRLFNNLTIASGGSLTITKANGKHKNAVNVKGALTVESGATLTVSGGALAGAYTLSSADQTNISQNNTGDLIVENGGTFNLNNGKWVQMDVIRFDSGSTVILTGKAEDHWDSIDMVYGQDVTVASGAEVTLTDAQLSTTQNGIMRINGKITLQSGSLLRATDNINKDGTLDDSISGKIIFGNGAKIKADKDSTAAIIGQDIKVDSGAEIIVASGGNLTLGGDYQKKEVHLTEAVTGSSEVVLNGKITAESGSTFKVGGTNELENGDKLTTTLTIENGTLINNTTTTVDANIVVEDTGKLEGSGSLNLASTGGLEMSSKKLETFLKTGKVDASAAGATLTFTDEVDLSKLDIFNTDGSSNGIKIGTDTVVAGDNVTMSAGLQGVTGYFLTKEGDDIKLGDNNYDGATSPLQWAKVIAHNTLDVQGKNDEFLIKGTALTLDRPYYQLDENGEVMKDDCSNQPIENTAGRVTGDTLILADDSSQPATSSLRAESGRWVVDNKIQVSGGTIRAIASSNTSPVYLKLNGDLTLTSTSGSSFVSVNGLRGKSTLDLSNIGRLTFANGTASHKNLNAANGGVLVMTGDQVEQILGDTANKVSIKVESGSTLQVTESLDLDFGDIVTSAAAYKIRLEGSVQNTIDVAGTLTMTTGEDKGTSSTALDIGVNKVQANSLILENLDSADDGSGNYVQEASVDIKSGTLVALSNLTVRNDNLLLGSGGKATLTLGDAVNYNSEKPAIGTVNAKQITLDSGSSVTSWGNWTQADGTLTVTNGTFTANGSYQGEELSIGASGKATFIGNEAGTASSFTKVTAAGTDSLQVNSGTLRIEGVEVKGEGPAANNTDPWGVNLANGAVKVGPDATLTFGNVASDHAFSVTSDVVTLGKGFGTIKLQGGTVELNFDQSFQNGLSAASLVSLKKTWLGGTGDNGALNGWLDIGDTAISDLSSILTASEDGTYYTATQAKYAPIVDVLASVKNEQVENLLLTEVKDDIKGVYGALQTTANKQTINIVDDTVLSNAGINGGNFATVGNSSELATLKVTGAELNLDSTKSAGAVGTVDLDGSSTLLLTGDKDITVAEITGSGQISAHTDTLVKAGIKGSSLYTYANVVVAGDVDLSGTDSSGKDDAGIFNHYEGVNGGTLLVASTNTDGSVTYHDVDTQGGADFDGGFLEAQNITLGADSYFVGDAVLRAHGKLTLGGNLYLGQASDDTCPSKAVEGSAGFMDVFELDLNSHDLILDPDYDQHASVGATQYFTGRNSTNEFDGGIANGDILIGQNSAFGIGATLAETQAALESLKLTDSTGALTNGTGAVLYVNRGFTVADGNKIVLDSTATRNELQNGQHPADKGTYVGYIEADSGIVMTDNAFGKDMKATAITFEESGAQIYAETGSKIILAGQRFTTTQTLSLLNDGDGKGVDIVGENGDGTGTIRVQTENGLLVYNMTGKEQGASVTLGLNQNARSILSGASDPIYETIVQYATNDLDGDTKTTDDKVLGEGYTPESIAAYEASNPRNEKLLVPNDPDNALLTASVNSGNGQAAESAARLAVYGGAVQAALTSAKSSSEVIASRMGIGAQAADLTTAENGVGGGLWVAPIYKNVDSDGFEAQGVDYGTDLNLYGVSLGADYAFMPELRVGLMFNVGSGDADGQGIASNVSNDFDYWGVGMYAGYNIGNFTVVADLGYSTVDNDVTAASNLADIGELSSSMDASIFTIGITGQYALEFSGVDIKPHAGLRYSSLDLDDYTVDSAVAGEVAGYEADSLSIFSIPVGVTISKDIVAGNWTVKPSFDLTLQGNFGDDEAEGTVGWNGVSNLDKNLTTEVFDNFTYGANLGVAAQTGTFSLGVGIGYVGCSNTDEFSASANARFTF